MPIGPDIISYETRPPVPKKLRKSWTPEKLMLIIVLGFAALGLAYVVFIVIYLVLARFGLVEFV